MSLAAPAHAWFRLGDSATATFPDTGQTATGFSVTLSTISATLTYSGTDSDREIFFQNTSDTYDVHCGTFSAVTAVAGVPRWILRKDRDYTANGTYDVYCVVEAAAGGTTVEVVGSVEFDYKD